MMPLFFIMCARSSDLGPYPARDAVLHRGRQQAIDRSCARAANHQNDQSRQQDEVILITLTFCAPVQFIKNPSW